MAKGSWTGTAGSVAIVTANEYRDSIMFQKTNATVAALGIGEAADAGKGIQLGPIGSVAIIRGAEARMAIYVIGNGATGTYQDGDVEARSGPYVT